VDILQLLQRGELIEKGGPAMIPLIALSVLSLSVILERLWFWTRILMQEREIVDRVISAVGESWELAAEIARQATDQPIGRFLYSPLRLTKTDAESFRLALESSAEDELAGMRRGEKLLEAVIALAPLLGLLGTVLGLIKSLGSLKIGDLGTESTANVPLGIGQALICTASGLIVAIFSLAFYRLFQGFVVNQVKVFRRAGNELELLYRQSPPDFSHRPAFTHEFPQENLEKPRKRGKKKLSDPPEPPEVLESLEPEQ
jgi:biopolymer transport protein ExbB